MDADPDLLGSCLQEVRFRGEAEGGEGVQRKESLQEAWHCPHSNQIWHLLHSKVPESGKHPRTLLLFMTRGFDAYEVQSAAEGGIPPEALGQLT